MYIWAKIPEPYLHLGSLEFSKRLLEDAKVAVSPESGSASTATDHVRFALIENEYRTRQALHGIKQMFRKDGLIDRTRLIRSLKKPRPNNTHGRHPRQR